MLYITRKEYFNAAHRLLNEDWTDEKNLDIYGKCSNKNWHGHNYELFVTVKGKINPDTGFVINMKILSEIIQEHIISFLDHSNLNLDVPFLKGINPTAENLVVKIWKQLEKPISEHNGQLFGLKLCETSKNIVEYFGDEG